MTRRGEKKNIYIYEMYPEIRVFVYTQLNKNGYIWGCYRIPYNLRIIKLKGNVAAQAIVWGHRNKPHFCVHPGGWEWEIIFLSSSTEMSMVGEKYIICERNREKGGTLMA